MQAGISNWEESASKDRKTILREEKRKKKKKKEEEREVEVRKTGEEGLLREVTVKIRLERIDI